MNGEYKVKKHTFIRTLLAMLAMLCWWGLFLPQLMINPDTCKVVVEEEVAESDLHEKMEQKEGYDLYLELLQAEEEQIVVKSRLWEYLKRIGWIE